ncbi:UNVERIFIED_CONTAM: hypothetical protein PYX00_001997 [Menopon gallinae]|uniref:Uncharacterized protein n=1 Tax=Menopon gallinae TaxID=328185 RepID=A0AAW2IF76_9NEOP
MKSLVILLVLALIAAAYSSPQRVTSFRTARLGPIPFPGEGQNEETVVGVVSVRCQRSAVGSEEETVCRKYCQTHGEGYVESECSGGFCHCKGRTN